MRIKNQISDKLNSESDIHVSSEEGPQENTLEKNNSKFIRIASFDVRDTTSQKLCDDILAAISFKSKIAVFFANTNFIVKCRFIVDDKLTLPLVLVNDGIGMDIAALLFHGRRFSENLNGTDFLPFFFQKAPRPLKVFMLGGAPDVLEKAVRHVTENLKQVVVGSSNGYDDVKNPLSLKERINQCCPDVVLVAMGNPIQEEWIVRHGLETNAIAFIGVGALFDFWSGDKARAPALIRRLRLEWLYRLCLEPRRLMRRYTFDIVVFLKYCFKYR